MPCVSLKSHALSTIVQHLCRNSNDVHAVHMCITVHLRCNGIFETYGRLIFNELVEKYEELLTDDLFVLCCHGNWKDVNIKGCKNVSLAGLSCVLNQ